MDPKDYTGKEWTDLLKEMNGRQIKNVMKQAYRRVGKKGEDIARRHLKTSGLGGDMNSLGRSIRTYVYSKGGGFLITVDARRANKSGKGEKSMYKTSRGVKKPILMWAEDGTNPRQSGGNVRYVYTGNVKWGSRHGKAYKLRRKRVRSGGRDRGKMPAYNFLKDSENEIAKMAENELQPEVEKAVLRAAKKAGWV